MQGCPSEGSSRVSAKSREGDLDARRGSCYGALGLAAEQENLQGQRGRRGPTAAEGPSEGGASRASHACWTASVHSRMRTLESRQESEIPRRAFF